jgi:hypothetical protein
LQLTLLLAGLGLLGAVLSSCRTIPGAVPIDAACQAFEPITYSSRDTASTRRQIVGHNSAFDALCAP